jgi:hypothetical protein
MGGNPILPRNEAAATEVGPIRPQLTTTWITFSCPHPFGVMLNSDMEVHVQKYKRPQHDG